MPRAGLLVIATLLATSSLTQAQTPVERGNYLVNGLLTCGNCHTPRGPGGAFAMVKQLSGGPQEWDRPTYKVRGANITPDKETGIGNWSEADLKRAITSGTRPDGAPLAPIMPYGFYKVFTASDLRRSLCLFPPMLSIRTIAHPANRRSIAAATRNNLRSCPLRATSISPTGSPPARGSGREIAQRSKKLAIAGLRRTNAFLAVKPSLLETSAIVGATIGVVGNASASRSDRRASIARTRTVRSRSMAM